MPDIMYEAWDEEIYVALMTEDEENDENIFSVVIQIPGISNVNSDVGAVLAFSSSKLVKLRHLFDKVTEYCAEHCDAVIVDGKHQGWKKKSRNFLETSFEAIYNNFEDDTYLV